MKLNKRGLSTVELVLVLIIVSLVSGIGYYVFNANKTSNKSTGTSTADTKTTVSTTPETKPIIEPKKYIEVKELGVKFEQVVGLEDVYYYNKPGTLYVYFSLNSLKQTDCAADKTSQLALSKYSQKDLDDDPAGETIKSSSKKIGEFYYFTQSGQASCSEDEVIMNKIGNAKQLIVKSIKESLQTIN